MKQKKINNFFDSEGYYNFGSIFDKKKCKNLREEIKKLRKLNKNIFYKSENEFKKKGRYTKYSPGAEDFNILLTNREKLNLDFIENSFAFKKAVESIMGKNFSIMKKSVIRSVPNNYLPKWLKIKLIDIGRPNLNPWIRDQFQDIQYFLNVDFHQDMTRGIKFCTFYIYLDDVGNINSCLKVLGGSYKHGAQPYPHHLRKSLYHKDIWYYDSNREVIKVKEYAVTGKAGTMFCFHGLNLHGSYYNFSRDPRISLRYLIKPDPKNLNIFNKTFKNIKNNIVIKDQSLSRLDRKPDGSFIPTGMSIR